MSTAAVEEFEVRLPEAEPTKFERERQAFYRLLPELLATHRGQYVAIHEGRVAGSGPDQLEVAMDVLKRVGNVALFVHLVTDEKPRVYRSGLLRDLTPAPGAA